MAFSNNHTLIAKGTEIKGDLVFVGDLQIEGKVSGCIMAEPGDGSRVVIAETGSVEGDIYSPKVIINGRVLGDVYAAGHVELAKKAEFTGVLTYAELQVVQGATINGKLVRETLENILKAPEAPENPTKIVSLASAP